MLKEIPEAEPHAQPFVSTMSPQIGTIGDHRGQCPSTRDAAPTHSLSRG